MRKIIIIILSCCTALLLFSYAGYRGYQAWREKDSLQKAKEAAARSDQRLAVMWLHQVFRFNPKNVEACRMMAELIEPTHSSSAIMWRERVLELNPGSVDDQLALVKTALLMKNLAVATNALGNVAEAARTKPEYHNLAGLIDLNFGNRETATSHFKEAARQEPWNQTPQVNLAMVRLSGTNAAEITEARSSLERISRTSTNAELRCATLRFLVEDAVRAEQPDSALTFSKLLVSQTNNTVQDQLMRLNVLQKLKSAEFNSALIAKEREFQDDENKVVQLAVWEILRLGPSRAFSWLETLPPATKTNDQVAVAVANCRALLGDWAGLQSSLGPKNWGDQDYLRHAFLARALREQGLAGAAKAEWVQAVESASIRRPNEPVAKQRERLQKLFAFAAGAKWENESEEILWKIVNQNPNDRLAGQALAGLLYARGRTSHLHNLFTLQSKRTPNDLEVKNNLAMTALLLNVQESNPHSLAKEVYDKAPTNVVFISTYAFSLHLQKKDAEALRILQSLSPKALESLAGYYGLVLSASGNAEKGKTYLDWALKRPMLPEERKLFENAKL